jgi:hypothetical protein
MAHTLGTVTARASSASNPITASTVVLPGETVLCVLLNVIGNSARTGGALTWGGDALSQASTTQIAASTPEASAELWYLLNPRPGTQTLTIPNTAAQTIKYTVVRAVAIAGGKSRLDAVNGASATSTNPSPGAVTCSEAGDFVVAVTAGGWQTWAPSAQAGTIIANTDDGATGGGEQYLLQATPGSVTLGWTMASDDWGAVVAAFKEVGPVRFENYLSVKVAGDGMSVNERIR